MSGVHLCLVLFCFIRSSYLIWILTEKLFYICTAAYPIPKVCPLQLYNFIYTPVGRHPS